MDGDVCSWPKLGQDDSNHLFSNRPNMAIGCKLVDHNNIQFKYKQDTYFGSYALLSNHDLI